MLSQPPASVPDAICMPVFCKQESCPSSQELLGFRNGEVDTSRIGIIRWHLTFCDFCAAELELYILYPPGDENIDSTPMPKHLRELAESILKRKRIEIIELSDEYGPA